jgi:hypothetical protein
MKGEQNSLFSAKDLAGSYTTGQKPHLELSSEALHQWKQRVLTFQSDVTVGEPVSQGNLFGDMLGIALNADSLNPLELPRQNTQFWRWKAEDAGVSSLYFVFDYGTGGSPLLLYTGETVKSNQRWKGEHGCKHYLLNYQQAHYHYSLPTEIGIAFWQDAPAQTKPRQQLERDLILKWRSPFNKENWTFWGTPFTHKA